MFRKLLSSAALLSVFCLSLDVFAKDKTVITAARLQKFTEPGSMGVVKDTAYIRCFWPSSELPFEPFAPGSSGIVVEGSPTPRNIIFPPNTVFSSNTRQDCFFKQDLSLPDDPDNPKKRLEISKEEALLIKKENVSNLKIK